MENSTNKRRRRFAGALGAFALVAAGTFAPHIAVAQVPGTPVSTTQNVTPTEFNTGPGGNVTCAELGYENTSPRSNYNPANDTFDAAFPDGITVTVDDGTFVDWTSDFGIGAVIVKGGNAANVYEYSPQKFSDTDLASPLNEGGQRPTLSNLTFCWDDVPDEGNPDIVIEKTLDEGPIVPGGDATFDFLVTNTGDVDLNNVKVYDPQFKACNKYIGFLGAGDVYDYSCTVKLPPGKTHTYADTFSRKSYHNNNGNTAWKGAWFEVDRRNARGVSQDPNSGNVSIGSNWMLWMRNKPGQHPLPSIARSANLYGATSAHLSFDWITWCGVDNGKDRVVVEVSATGKDPFTVLKTFSWKSCAKKRFEKFDISQYISANTRVRFRIANGYMEDNEMFKVDNVMIKAQKPPKDFVNKACVSGEYAGETVRACDKAPVNFGDY
jgi:hypothetical protein